MSERELDEIARMLWDDAIASSRRLPAHMVGMTWASAGVADRDFWRGLARAFLAST